MESYFLTREEYKFLLLYKFRDNSHLSEISEIIDRAGTTWDINVVGSNYLLSILLEQEMKRGENVDKAYIDGIYELTEQFYFTIDELDQSVIDYVIRNHVPKNRMYYSLEYIKAKKANQEELALDLESKMKGAFEEDFIEILSIYYEKN